MWFEHDTHAILLNKHPFPVADVTMIASSEHVLQRIYGTD